MIFNNLATLSFYVWLPWASRVKHQVTSSPACLPHLCDVRSTLCLFLGCLSWDGGGVHLRMRPKLLFIGSQNGNSQPPCSWLQPRTSYAAGLVCAQPRHTQRLWCRLRRTWPSGIASRWCLGESQHHKNECFTGSSLLSLLPAGLANRTARLVKKELAWELQKCAWQRSET